MHKTYFIFLLFFTYHSLLCMEETESKTTLVAWIDNNTIFVGKNNKYIVMNPFTEEVKQQQSSFKQRSEWSLDIAVNKTCTQYAISFGNGSIRCFDTKTHKLLWLTKSPVNYYPSITFNSQNENQIVYSELYSNTSQLLYTPTDQPKSFYSTTINPL